MNDHSNVMGGSTAQRRIMCPGSLKLEQNDASTSSTSEAAEHGRLLHSAMEMLLVHDFQRATDAKKVALELVDQSLGGAIDITSTDVNVKIYPALKAWIALNRKHKLEDWLIEQRVSLGSVIKGAFGIADVIAIDKKNNLHIIDWKFGDGVLVPAENNYALAFYAAAALYDPEPEVADMLSAVNEKSKVYFHIVQPTTHANEPVHKEWETTVDYIENFINLAEEAVSQAHSPDPPFCIGSWCQWCTAKPSCKEYSKKAQHALSIDTTKIADPEWPDILDLAYQLESWIKRVKEQAQKKLENGVAIPRYKLVQKRASRRWVDEEAFLAVLRKKHPGYVTEVAPRKLITPTQFEKLHPQVYAKHSETHVNTLSSGVTLAPDEDKRPAVQPNNFNALAKALGGAERQQKQKQ